MAGDNNEKTQRRVYVLPTELVERITAFQTRMGLASEVEAARRLLDEALMHREDAEQIIKNFTQKMKETKILSDIAKDVLVGHPKVSQIQFDGPSVRVSLTDGEEITFYGHGGGRLNRQFGEPVKFDANGELDEIPF
jgi:hypothetical protein